MAECEQLSRMCHTTIERFVAQDHQAEETAELLHMYSSNKFEEFISLQSGSFVAVAIGHDGSIIGTATLSDLSSHQEVSTDAAMSAAAAQLWIRRMIVHADFQRQRVGARLLEHLERIAMARACVHLRLHAEPSAVGFYERFGFKTLSVEQSFGGATSLMCKVLGQSERALASAAAPSKTPKRVILWTAPRCGSSAFSRSFMQRSDTRVFFEHLFDAFYLGPDRRSTNFGCDGGGLVWDGLPWRSFGEVYRDMLAPVTEPISLVFAKEMAYYIVPSDEAQPLDWTDELDKFEHTFLIRSPRRQVPSFVRILLGAEHAGGLEPAALDPAEVGVVQLHRLFCAAKERTGRTPVVIDAEDMWRDPRATLTAYCAAVGVPFDEGMLSWSSGWRAEFRFWDDAWVRDVLASTGFLRQGSTERQSGPAVPSLDPLPSASDVILPASMEAAMNAAMPRYEHMRAHKLDIHLHGHR